MEFDENSEVKIDIYKWKGEDIVDIEIDCGGLNTIEISTSTMKEADLFIKALRAATKNVEKHKVNEDGTLA